MKAEEIRDTYLSFFEERGHQIVPSASLVPSVHDPSVLLTTAGMQPFKPYFLGRSGPPAPRLADVQKCFRTTDIEEVGNTARHLTFFEMLGNWSFGDYFKAESIPWGWELATQGFGMDPERIWATVFGGDEELGLGPDEEAIEIWKGVGMPEERIVLLGREDNFWQAGPTGPCGPCSELYLDRGEDFGAAGERPGDDTDRFLEFWNHVFMTYDLSAEGVLTELPMRNIDTGMGLDRMAAILQDVPSVFETDLVRPLIDLAEELSGHSYGGGWSGDAGDADRRRPLAWRRLPDRRRRRPLQRRPRLHPAPDHAPGDPAGAHAGPGGALAGPLRRAHDRGHGRRLPRAGGGAGDDRPLGRRRGGELRPHPRARHRAARAADRRGARSPTPPGSTPPMPSSCTTPTASPTT